MTPTDMTEPRPRTASNPMRRLLRREPAPPVAFYRRDAGEPPGHDAITKMAVAERIAALLGSEFAGEHGPGQPLGRPHYLVPSDTLCSVAEARRLGVTGPDDLFGGVVPRPFIATKVVTHGLVRPGAKAPAGWAGALGARLADAVLPGYSVFTPEDARLAGERLLEQGPVRIKSAAGVGGLGQSVAHDSAELRAQLDALDPELLASAGWVLELNLAAQVETFSVGRVQIGGHTAAYYGRQHNTRNHRDHEVYGGSEIHVVRGGFDALLKLQLPAPARAAVTKTIAYHVATHRAYPGLYASRVNYDVVHGLDAEGRERCGVLEQSWRIGGASGAELAALHAFRDDDRLKTVSASTHEVYHDGTFQPPSRARVVYDGTDPVVGRLTKYVQVQPRHADT
jgi:hypothetical protein